MTEELRRKHIETLEVLQEFQDENDALKSKLAGSAASEVEALRASLASATSGREAAEAKAEAAAASAKEAAKKQRSAENGLRTERSLRAAETAEAEAAAAASADAIRRLENERDDAVHTAAARADADAKQVAALEAKAAESARELDKARVVAAAYKAANEQDSGRADALDQEKTALAEKLRRMTTHQYELGERAREHEAAADAARAELLEASRTVVAPAPPPAPATASVATQTDGDDPAAVAAARDALAEKVDALERRLAESHRGITVKPSPPAADAPFGDYVGIKRENAKLRMELAELRSAHVALAEAAPERRAAPAKGARVSAARAPALPGIAAKRPSGLRQ